VGAASAAGWKFEAGKSVRHPGALLTIIVAVPVIAVESS